MRRLTGQAARHTGRLLHFLVQLAFAIVLTTGLAAAVLAWRLSQGPLDMPWLTQRVTAAVDAETPGHLALGGAALAWEGFNAGRDQPLDIRLTDLTLTADDGAKLASVPRAEVALSLGWLLLGRLVPRAIEIDGARVAAIRAADGSLTLDLGGQPQAAPSAMAAGTPAALLRELSRPVDTDRARARSSRWSQLRRVRITDAAARIDDRVLGVVWRAPMVSIDLLRRAQGGVTGQAEAKLALGDVGAELTMTADLNGEDRGTHLAAKLTPLTPAAFARLLPALAAVDAPVGLSATADLDGALRPTHLAAYADLGAGTLHVGAGAMALIDGHLEARGTLDALHVAATRLEVAPRADGHRTVVTAQADVTHGGNGGFQVGGVLDLDHVAFADLPALWPEDIGRDGTRPWITGNITDGVARNGHAAFTLSVPPDLSDATVTKIDAGIDGHGLTVHWLRPVPPIERAEAHLSIRDPDALTIDVTAGHQAGGAQGGLTVQSGRVMVSGLNEKDQLADITAVISGPVPDLLGLLNHPRIKLLQRSPLKLSDAAGQIAGTVSVTRLKLRDDVTFDEVQIHTESRTTDLRLTGIAAGHDLDHGMIAITASQDGLRAVGQARVAAIPAHLQLDMDFRAGAPSDVVQHVQATGRADAKQMAGAGLDLGGFLDGAIDLSIDLATRRDKSATLTVNGDLSDAALKLDRLGYAKPLGKDASLSARLLLTNDRLTAVEQVHAKGDGVLIDATADVAGGAPSVLHVRHVVLGEGTDLHGEITLPAVAGQPYVVTVAGASLDASAELRRGDASSPRPKPSPTHGPPWRIDATLDRLILGPDRAARAVSLHAENDGTVLRRATINARTPADAAFQLSIAPTAGGRRLEASTRDAGGLLRLLDVVQTMQGGRLSLTGTYDDSTDAHRLTGTATIEDFRIRNAPVVARLLQGMTLYGLVQLAEGPGLPFTSLIAPYSYANDELTLTDARAFNSSLGMTAKGRVDLARQEAEVTGTIVPAYFFNTLLGRIPLVGKFFSPERGGGVFAATYAVHGKLANPDVAINPLAALTPGILRGLFKLF